MRLLIVKSFHHAAVVAGPIYIDFILCAVENHTEIFQNRLFLLICRNERPITIQYSNISDIIADGNFLECLTAEHSIYVGQWKIPSFLGCLQKPQIDQILNKEGHKNSSILLTKDYRFTKTVPLCYYEWK